MLHASLKKIPGSNIILSVAKREEYNKKKNKAAK